MIKQVKRCPFKCGPTHDSGLNAVSDLNCESLQWTVQCICGARGPEADTRDAAVDAWNNRIVDDELVDIPKHTKSILKRLKAQGAKINRSDEENG